MNQSTTTRTLAELFAVAAFCAFLFFLGLGAIGLLGADEPRYAQIAREMLARQDWVTPVLHGRPWLEKPVLYYWEAMVSYRLLGVSDWAARLPSAGSATVMVLAIYCFMRRFRQGSQLDAALIAASSAGIIGFARGASTDMPMTAAFTVGMLGWMTWHQTGQRRWLAVFYCLMAVASLGKGPVAPFLAAAIVVVFAIIRRDPRVVLRTLWLPGILLFLVIALPWYMAVQQANPQFFNEFILQHNLARFASNKYRHPQPFWFYGTIVPLSVAPWIVFSMIALFSRARANTAPDYPGPARPGDFRLLLVLWVFVPTVFFSFSGSKLPGYTLPVVPPLALLVADYLRRKLTAGEPASRIAVLLHAAVTAALLGGALLSSYPATRTWPQQQAWLVAVLIALIAFAAVALTVLLRGLRTTRFVTLVPVIVGLAFVLKVAAPTLDARLSARPVAMELIRLEGGQSTVAAFNVSRETEYGLAFYRNHEILRYERGQVPSENHLLLTRTGSADKVAALLPGRRMSHVGGFAPQGIEFYWISN